LICHRGNDRCFEFRHEIFLLGAPVQNRARFTGLPALMITEILALGWKFQGDVGADLSAIVCKAGKFRG
jgi:hypothetical protein